MQIALTFILARTVARMVQFSSGLESALAQSQVYTLVLDGGLVLVATILLTIVPPGPSLGRAWRITSPSTRKVQRHIAALESLPRSPGSPLLYLHGSPIASPQHQDGRGYGPANSTKEPRSPPPSITTNNSGTAIGSGYGYGYHGNQPSTARTGGSGAAASKARRYSPSWISHKRQHSATEPAFPTFAEPPPYERPANRIAQVPYMPPSLSQQYGQGSIVESHVVAPGSEGSRTGGSGGTTGYTARTRRSPRAQEDMVQHDAIW